MPSNRDELVLGRIVRGPIEEIQTLPAKPQVQKVTAVCNEVTGLCPITGQPDIYTVIVEYETDKGTVIESKSLKLFLWQYRDQGISCEDLAADIAQKLTEQYGSVVKVTAKQQPRGGISLIAEAKGEL